MRAGFILQCFDRCNDNNDNNKWWLINRVTADNQIDMLKKYVFYHSQPHFKLTIAEFTIEIRQDSSVHFHEPRHRFHRSADFNPLPVPLVLT